MTRAARWAGAVVVGVLLAGCGDAGAPRGGAALDAEKAAERARLRALGKAFYENPATRQEAVDVLRQAWEIEPGSACDHVNYALALLRVGRTTEGVAELEHVQVAAPELPHTYFNLGIAYKNTEPARAREQFTRMVELVPDEPVSRFNLGVLLKLEGDFAGAIAQLEAAEALAPHLTGPPFQLAATFRQLDRPAAAAAAMERFRAVKAATENAAVPEDLEWSFYAELCEVVDPRSAPEPLPPADLELEVTVLARGLEAPGARLELVDANGDGRLDLLLLSGSRLYVFDASGALLDVGLGRLAGVVAVAVGDADGDGAMDLAVVDGTGAGLYLNREGRFQADETSGWPDGSYRGALWLDVDHDYDLDVMLLGAASRLMRNDGAPLGAERPAWSDRSASFPFVDGAVAAAVLFDLEPDTQGRDVLTVAGDGAATLYRDRLTGRFDPQALPALPRGVRELAAGDLDGDGRTDVVAIDARGLTWLRNTESSLDARRWVEEEEPVFAWGDLQNRGRPDLVTARGIRRGAAPGGAPPEEPSWPAALPAAAAVAVADFDADGLLDLAALGRDGALRLARNRTAGGGHFVSVSLVGSKNPPRAPQAIVEVKSGGYYAKRTYRGRPVHFGLGSAAGVDTVRITWANGLVQNEIEVAADRAHHFVEAQRLSGSCPMIYTWDGTGFRFVTDVLGVAPLGAAAGDGETFPVDHDEHVQIPADALVERDGGLEVRLVEELREVAYLDQIELLAVDREADLDVFVNDKFEGPPFAHELELYGARRRLRPIGAVDHRGRDVLDRVLARDRTYPDDFERSRAAVAERHFLELDFGPVAADNEALLVLSGWVDWADGSTFLATAQHPEAALLFPSLEVPDAAGEWRTVVPDMGMPAGKPKTIVVDLRGKFLSAERRVRITSNLAVYWDEAFLIEDAIDPPVRLTRLRAAAASLGFAGFSRVIVDPDRDQPETFVYADRRPTSMWNPTPGLYTRYGDVRELLGEVDDRFVVMGSGDEVRLRFAASALPPLPAGWRRDWVLKVDGWAKDGDANTIHSQTVEPLPFHAMPAYPYPEPYAYPDTPRHREYLETYQTRPALVLNRPLAPPGGTDAVPAAASPSSDRRP